MSGQSDAIARVREAAHALAAERVRFSQEYQVAYMRQGNGFLAHQIAIEKTGDAVTIAEAELKIAEAEL